ncbi:uncharacterized protein DUF4174 [Christiangramia gaetbulicola]|uniref:Uncharacterized protein DUF4174 n=1 Tax=Christiangramia gaetbulicola TaxID=703340 RepID=A0A2T6AN92_9FLAO|nr:DUF4174 domain-containing protein [Christiangramia gaetbulicola]PTX45226.1 uncharacterized protein DUF4174 [Christiangramia gaetbulicola]
MKKVLILILLFLAIPSMSAQSLSEYQWENRLIVIFTEAEDSKEFQEQFEELESDITGLKDRKLLIIHSLPQKQRTILPKETRWQDSNLYQNRKGSEESFEVILIGLDGGVKLRQNQILTTKKLFGLIDSMPMRQAEMRRNKN